MNFNQKLRFSFPFLILLILYVSCNKNDLSKQSINETQLKNEVKDWLHEYGESYKTEKIHVLSSDQSISEGSLDWNGATSYIFNGKQYLDVPFSFNGQYYIEGNDSTISSMSYDLVVRKDSLDQGYEGSIRTTTQSVVEDIYGQNRNIKELQSYQNIDGSLSTVYLNNDHDSSVLGQRLYISKDAISQLRYIKTLKLNNISVASSKYKSGGLMLVKPPGDVLQDCTIYSSTTNVTHCYGPDASVTCYSLPETSYVSICGGDGYTGSSGGSNSPGSTGGTNQTWPPKNNNNTSKKDPCEEVKNGTTMANNILKDKSIKAKVDIYKNEVSTITNEKGFSIVKIGDSYETAEEKTGTDGTAVNITTSATNMVIAGGFHEHTNDVYNALSVGDLYTILQGVSSNSNFQVFYNLNPDKSLYAFIVTDASIAKRFLAQYPRKENVDEVKGTWLGNSIMANTYNDAFNNYRNKGLTEDESYTNAMAAVLSEISAGVKMLKADANGNLTPIFVNKTISNGQNTYSIDGCPN